MRFNRYDSFYHIFISVEALCLIYVSNDLMWGDRVDRFRDTQVMGVEVSSSLLSPHWAWPDEVVNGLLLRVNRFLELCLYSFMWLFSSQ